MVDFRQPPAKQLYVLAQVVLTLVFRLPTWVLVSALPALRPNPNWSFARALYVRLQSRIALIDTAVQGFDAHPTHRAIAPAHAECAVWLDPVPELLAGEIAALATAAAVDAVRVPGYWYYCPGTPLAYGAPAAAGEKVVLAFHGGSYIVRSANPGDPSAGSVHGLLAHVPAVRRALGLEYRLSTSVPGRPANPFPAALLDALAAYAYLVNTAGFRPEDIVLAGDSAGGNLALALTRYLLEHRVGLGPPGALLLFSPWADMGSSHATPQPPYLRRTDWIWYGDEASAYAPAVFAGPHGPGLLDANAYASPASTRLAPPSFAGWPRTFIACGRDECFAPAIRALAARMAADMGPALEYYEEPDAVHAFVSLAWHEPERTRALRRVADWLAAAP